MESTSTSFGFGLQHLSISVVIPTYNRERLIGRAIHSALQQTWLPAEIIVVDDGSTDETRDRVLSFGEPVRYVRQPNAGAAAARNRGTLEARFDWVAFLDSDDLWYDTHLENVARAIRATSGVAGFYFADTLRPSGAGVRRLWEICNFSVDGEHELTLDATDWVLGPRQPMMLQSSVVLRSAYLQSGGLWESLRSRHDTHFFLKLGIGRPACAVAGCGAQMTADSDPEERLTFQHTRWNASGYIQQVLMLQDVLNWAGNLTPAQRQCLRTRVAGAYLALARIAWNERRPLIAARHAGRAMRAQPRRFLRGLRGLVVTASWEPSQDNS